EINKLLIDPVVLAVADDRRCVLVIQSVVLANFLSQLRDDFLGFGSIHRFRAQYGRAKARQRWNALSLTPWLSAARLIVAPSAIRLSIVFGEADPPFNFLKQQLSIRNRETR